MNTAELLHLERATNFLSEQPCTKLELLQLRLCLDVGASEPPKRCYLVLTPLIGTGDIDIVYALHEPASKSMMERIVEKLGDILDSQDADYPYHFAAVLMNTWLHAPIGIALQDAKSFASRLDLQYFRSAAELATVEFQVTVHCALAGYSSVLDDLLPLGSLVEQSVLEEACGLANGILVPRREYT